MSQYLLDLLNHNQCFHIFWLRIQLILSYVQLIYYELLYHHYGLLKQELKNLNDREKQIMTLRYGLNETEEYTQKEVAEMLGISQSYISRIEKKIIKKLKTLMEIN